MRGEGETYELFHPVTHDFLWQWGKFRIENNARKCVWVIILCSKATTRKMSLRRATHGRGMISHHDQISVPSIAKRASQVHEPLALVLCVPKHDPALEVVCFVQKAIRDQLVLGIYFDRHLQRRIRRALDGSECHTSISARRDKSLYVESVLAIGEDWV